RRAMAAGPRRRGGGPDRARDGRPRLERSRKWLVASALRLGQAQRQLEQAERTPAAELEQLLQDRRRERRRRRPLEQEQGSVGLEPDELEPRERGVVRKQARLVATDAHEQ